MDIKITSQKRKEYLYSKSSGVLNTADDWIKTDALIAAEIINHNANKILVDQQEIIFPKSDSILKTLLAIKSYSDNFPINARKWKIAVVLKPEYKELGRFWETACSNRGYYWNVFYNLNDAIEYIRN
jgi:hypothetical protein